MKKVPLLPKTVKKDTLFSDLLRSEPYTEKGTLFCEFLNKHVNRYRKCGAPGFFSFPVRERPFWIWIKLLKLRPILGVIIREKQGYNLLKVHANGE